MIKRNGAAQYIICRANSDETKIEALCGLVSCHQAIKIFHTAAHQVKDTKASLLESRKTGCFQQEQGTQNLDSL